MVNLNTHFTGILVMLFNFILINWSVNDAYHHFDLHLFFFLVGILTYILASLIAVPLIYYGLQHYLSLVGSLVLIPLVMVPAMGGTDVSLCLYVMVPRRIGSFPYSYVFTFTSMMTEGYC